MYRLSPSIPRNRAVVFALVLGVHGLLLLLLAGRHIAERDESPAPELTGVWIQLPPLLPPPAQRQEPEEEARDPAATPPTQLRRDERVPAPLPRTAITLPTAPDTPVERVEGATAQPRVDWYAEGAKVAAEAAEEKPTGIGPPLEVMREPCKPQVSSLWGKPKEPRPEEPPAWTDQVVPSAYTVTGAARHTIKGGFSVPLGKPEPRKDLFDDMLAGKTPRSSVPHPNICD